MKRREKGPAANIDLNAIVRSLRVKKLIREIYELRKRAWVAPPHWDHEPTEEELELEDEAIGEAAKYESKLRRRVAELAEALRGFGE